MKRLIWLVFGVLSYSSIAAAQEAPRVDVSLGYSYLREGFSGGANTHGGGISGAVYLRDWLGLVGDFGVYHLSSYRFRKPLPEVLRAVLPVIVVLSNRRAANHVCSGPDNGAAALDRPLKIFEEGD